MNWEELRRNKCPKCSRGFASKHVDKKTLIIKHSCDFEITVDEVDNYLVNGIEPKRK